MAQANDHDQERQGHLEGGRVVLSSGGCRQAPRYQLRRSSVRLAALLQFNQRFLVTNGFLYKKQTIKNKKKNVCCFLEQQVYT